MGSRLATGLREDGYDVVASVRVEDSRPDPSATGFQVADVLNPDQLRAVHGDVDVLVHLAGITGTGNCAARPEEAFRVNVQGTQNVAWLCRDRDIPLVFSSSMAALGPPSGPEVTPDHPRRPSSLYGLTKAMSEEDVERLSDDRFPAYVMRVANVFGSYPFGPVSFTSVVDVFIEQALVDGTITVHAPGSQRRDFVYIDDVVSAFLAAIDSAGSARPGPHVLPIASGTSHSVLEVAECVRDVARRERDADPGITLVETDDASAEATRLDIDTAATVNELSFRPEYDLVAGIADALCRAE